MTPARPNQHSVDVSVDMAGTLSTVRMEPMEQTRADRLRALEAQYGATSTRTVRDGLVWLSLEMANGDRITGRGADTEAALTHLETRLAALNLEG